MKAIVDESVCMGAGVCEDTCPKVFKVVNGISQVQVDTVPVEEEDRARQAAEGCPSGAISLE